MHVFFIIFLLRFYTTIVIADNDAKYIDLLPEKEKEEFLEQIARRILQEVETKGEKLKDSDDVSDAQLNVHDEFVRKIFQEESENLRKQANDTVYDGNPKTNYGPPVLRKEDEIKVQQYVDLTLRADNSRSKRDNNRRVFTGYAPNSDNNTENNNNKGDESELDVQVRNFRKNTDNHDEVTKPEENDFIGPNDVKTTERIITEIHDYNEENNITEIIKRIYENNDQEIEATTEENIIDKKLTISKNYSNKVDETTISNDDPNLIDSPTTKNILNFFTAEVTASEPIAYDVIQKTFDPLRNTSYEDTAVIENEHGIMNKDGLRAYALNNAEEIVILRSDKENKTKAVRTEFQNFTSNLEVNVTTESNKNDSRVINIEIVTNPAVKDVPTLSELEMLTSIPTDATHLNSDRITNSTTILNEDTTKNQLINTESVTEISKMKSSPSNNLSPASKNLFNDVMKALRENLIINGKKDDDNKNPPQEYRVFEISSDASPFVKKDLPKKKILQKSAKLHQLNKVKPKLLELKRKPKNKNSEISIKEEPYRVPIYNFMPKNAYYNPHNVLGLNLNNEEDVSKTDEDAFPSLKPDSSNIKQIKMSGTSNQPMQVPIYIFSPDNAFFNPKNDLGFNEGDINLEEKQHNVDENNLSEDYEDQNENKIKERDQIEWQYYNDAPEKKTKNVKILQINMDNNKSVLNNLGKIVKDLLAKGKEKRKILSDDLDWESKKPKALLRCLYKQKCGQVEEDPKSISGEGDANVTDTEEFANTMSKVRHMMLVSGHFMLVKKGNFSKLDAYFESAEKVKSNDDEEKSAENTLRAILDVNELQGRKSREVNQNLDIATDYYFERPKTEKGRKQRDVKDLNINPLALVYNKYKSGDNVKKQPLRTKLRPPRKTDKEIEYLVIKDLAKAIDDPEIEKLYWQLEIIEKLNLKPKQISRKNSQDLDSYIEVLQDMVEGNNKGLKNYDWLGTTVDLQSAIKKMVDITEAVGNDEDIHPSDLELLKYLVWLHTFAKEELNQNTLPKELRGLKIPAGKKRRGKIIKESGLLYRAWLIRVRPKPIPDDELEAFQEFLEQLQDSLYDLHTALKYIAMVTKHKKQRWFENLKQIHVEINRKRLLELILHLSTTRLLGIIEEPAKNGLEDNFREYVKKNEREVERTREEFIFVLKLLEEYKHLK